MNEPLYEFVKGKGWVPRSHDEPKSAVMFTHGHFVRVTERMPKVGEYYMTIDDGSVIGRKHPTFEEKVEWLCNTFRVARITAGAGNPLHPNINITKANCHYFTIEVLD